MKRFGSTIFFSEDLLIEILSRLPVKSLVRFNCVCKSWYALFQNPNLISKHLINSNNNINDVHHRIIVGRRRNNNVYCFMSISNKNLDNVVYEDLGFPYCDIYWHKKSVLGAYNGVVSFYIEKRREIVFWNPATRETKIVAPVLTNGFTYRHGFGYDFEANDYMLITLSTALSSKAQIVYEVEVYCLSNDSWRKSNAIIPDGFCVSSFCRSTCIKGMYSITVSRYDEESKVRYYILLTFDVSNDVFLITLFPEGIEFGEIGEKEKVYFESLNDSFALIVHNYESGVSGGCFEISVLNEYGAAGFWTKLYTIELSSYSLCQCPLGFWKNNLLFRDNYNTGLTLSNLTTHELKKIEIDGLLLLLVECKESIVSFKKESLVSLNGSDHPFQKDNSAKLH